VNNLNLQLLDIILILTIVLGAAAAGLFFLNRWSSTKMVEQDKMIEQTKQTVSIFTIDKKKCRPAEAGLPKAIVDSMPKRAKIMKAPFIKAKMGAQITTLMCDPRIYDAIPLQKQIRVDVAGIYIVDFKGRKSDEEMKAQGRGKKSFLSNLNPFSK